MVFSSHLFLFWFLPLALAAYHAVPARRRHLALTLVSFLFYGWANPLYVPVLLLSMGIDYVAGLRIAGARVFGGGPDPAPLPVDGPRTRGQRIALAVSMTANLAVLGFFKYFNFAADNLAAAAEALGLDGAALRPAFQVALPLGISFYTFQSMSYTIDVYRGHAAAMRSFTDFACFVTMFPQLVAGPIIRFGEVADQLRSRTHTATKFARGVTFFCLGLGKKVLLANPCGFIADTVFATGSREPADAWAGLLAYALQIYYDFSGYSDMAVGLGLMMGFTFARNFDSPYSSAGVTEFWRRWHMSLSFFLRDYLYIPLGGNRRGRVRTYVNLMVVMLLGGLWHGASWNFVVWGGLHGGMLAIERAAGGPLWRALPRPVGIALTFLVVCVGWVFFRAETLPAATDYLRSLIGVLPVQDGAALARLMWVTPYHLGMLVVAAGFTWIGPDVWEWTRRLTAGRAALVLAVFVVSVLLLWTQAYNPFIYFIF